MPGHFYVYVAKESRENLEIGRARGVWGWRSTALDRRNRLDHRTGRDVARSMSTGDYFILASGGPGGPRKPEPEFVTTPLDELVICRVTRPLYSSTQPVWPDDVYPERVGLDVIDTVGPVHPARVGARTMRNLRRSGIILGIPVTGDDVSVAELILGTTLDGDHLQDIDGDLDAITQTKRRREQQDLRRKKFGFRSMIACDLCGRLLPARLIVAAHIKPRAEAFRSERLHLANIMAACLLGCDAMFEQGFVHVDSEGVVRASGSLDNDLEPSVRALDGRRCAAFTAMSRPYFRYHAARSGRSWDDRIARQDLAWLTADWAQAPVMHRSQGPDLRLREAVEPRVVPRKHS